MVAPHTPQTEGMFGARELRLLPDGALLVNVARGKLVDTAALLAELSTGRITAALDVTEPEPLAAGHPLWHAPGVLISPHVGGASSAFAPRADRLMAAQLRRFAAGEPLANVVRPGHAAPLGGHSRLAGVASSSGMSGLASLALSTGPPRRISDWTASFMSQTLTFMPASTRPSLSQNATNSRSSLSPRNTTSS